MSLSVLVILIHSCTTGQSQGIKTNLTAKEFSDKIESMPSSNIIDVRTPDEYSKGHIKNAKNINWNGDEFSVELSKLEKTKPVFVYCLSGGRSSAAANKMRAEGFKEVYELSGGIMKWRAANLPETTENSPSSSGMTVEQFNALLKNDKLVLIDFYADWCAPCKKMKPYLDEFASEMSKTVEVIRINADEHPELSKALRIDALPTLILYKNKNIAWTHTGYLEKAEVVKQLQ